MATPTVNGVSVASITTLFGVAFASVTSLNGTILSSSNDANVSLNGVSLTSAVNAPASITGSATLTLDSVGTTTAVHAPTVAIGQVVSLTGVSLTAAVHTPTVAGNASVTVTGRSLTTVVGTLAASGTDVPAPLAVTVYQGDDTNAHYASTDATGQTLSGGIWFTPGDGPMVTGHDWDHATVNLVTVSGQTCLRMRYAGVSQEGPSWFLFGVTPAIAADKAILISYQARIIPASAPLTTEFPIKWCIAEHTGLAGGAGAQWSTHNHLPWSGTGEPTYWQCYDGGYTDEASAYTVGHDQGTQPQGPYFNDIADGALHTFDHYYKSHTSSSVKDGFFRMWVDGIPIIDVREAMVGIGPVGGTKQWCGQDIADNLVVATGIEANYTVKLGATYTGDTNNNAVDLEIPINTFLMTRDA